jgi:hypothetical protein
MVRLCFQFVLCSLYVYCLVNVSLQLVVSLLPADHLEAFQPMRLPVINVDLWVVAVYNFARRYQLFS